MSAPAFAQEFLINGSFETGDLSGWTWSGNTGFTSVVASGFAGVTAEDGSYFLYEGPIGPDGILSQTFSDVAGTTLSFTGWVNGAPNNNTSPSNFTVTFNGAQDYIQSPVNTNGWLEVTFTAVATGNDTVALNFANDPAFNSLDNFSVTGTAPGAPEPSTWAMMGLGFAGLAFAGYRSRRSAAAIA